MVTREQIRDAMHRHPFRPFKLYVVGGRSYTVMHPDFIAVSPVPQGPCISVNDRRGSHTINLSAIDRIVIQDSSRSNP